MVMLNFLIPILSWSFIWTDNSNALNECLGKGYLKFLSIKGHYCTEDNILCWAWLFLVIILISNIIDVYCIYQCIKDIKKSTEKSRNMLSKQAYTNRKRFAMDESFTKHLPFLLLAKNLKKQSFEVPFRDF
jgi:hypothetical protein